jgi:hypothetical protein
MFDLVMVLGLNVAEDVPDDGTDAGEYQAGDDDGREDHGGALLLIRPDGLRAPSREATGKLVTESGFFFAQQRHALLETDCAEAYEGLDRLGRRQPPDRGPRSVVFVFDESDHQ